MSVIFWFIFIMFMVLFCIISKPLNSHWCSVLTLCIPCILCLLKLFKVKFFKFNNKYTFGLLILLKLANLTWLKMYKIRKTLLLFLWLSSIIIMTSEFYFLQFSFNNKNLICFLVLFFKKNSLGKMKLGKCKFLYQLT